MPVPRGLVNACEPGGMSRRCLAYQLAARGGKPVPLVQQNPVAIRKKALQYSGGSQISPRTAATRDRLAEPECSTPNRIPHI
jgi:hypothetical protein